VKKIENQLRDINIIGKSKIYTIGLITNLKAESEKAEHVSDSSSASSSVCGEYKKKKLIILY